MRTNPVIRGVFLAMATLAGTACFLGGNQPAPQAVTRVVRVDTTRPPMLPAESMVEQRSPNAPEPQPSVPERLITLTAVNADVRPLLIGIAREANIDLVVTSDVNQRVSINLKDTPATEAIVAIASAANLTFARPPQPELPPVVFYQLPVNINRESAAVIANRFGVSLALAKFIVGTRD